MMLINKSVPFSSGILFCSFISGMTLLFGSLLADKAFAAAQSTYTPAMADYCVQPPFLSGYVPPQVLFTMGKDHKYYLPAYNDSSDIDGDGIIETTYKHSFDYYGYFDSAKCYSYASGKFTPYGITSDKYCSTTNCTDSSGASINCSGKFSGNFLNWATMSRSDIVKMVIYGGFRTSDNNGTNYAELSGEFIPQDGHIWGKEYYGSDASKLFTGGVANKRALFCVNGTTSGSNSISQLKILPDVTAVNSGLRAWHWINVNGNSDICSDTKIDTNGDGSAETVTLTGRTNYAVTVKVCDPGDGYNYVGDWEKKHCKNYSTATPQASTGPWRPVGLMQIYGETANSAKVCSKDMSTSCTNDNGCTGNGQCVNASNMFFGLMMGTYQNMQAGGVLRKSIYSINEETNQSNGILQTSASSGKGLLMKSIEALTAPVTYPLVTHIGNPMAEIMYEGLRYWGGKTSATAAFMNNINSNGGTTADAGKYISVAPWDAPATNYPSCSIPFNLVFSDVYNSYDHDQVPGSSFATVTGDLTNMNVTTQANTIWANENLGTSIVTGESGTTSGANTDGTCSVKTVSGLGNVKGLCPAEPTMSGSYYPASVALYGHNSMYANQGTPNVLTYVVAFPSNVPSITVYTDSGKAALVAPYAKSVSSSSWTNNGNTVSWNCTTTNTDMKTAYFTDVSGVSQLNLTMTPKNSTSNCPTMAPVSFYLEETEYNASNQLKYAKFVVASDDLGGGDYDLDMLVRYTVCAQGYSSAAAIAACPTLTGDQVSVKVERVYSAAGNIAALGYTIDNVGSNSGSYLVVQHAKTASNNWPANMGDSPGLPIWTNASGTVTHLPNGCPTTSTNCTGTPTLKFNAASSTVVIPKPPLWYAAKYGGFKDSDNDGLPYTDATCSYALTNASRNSKCNEWSSKVPGVPDTYFEVSNPSQMEQRLRDAFEAILARVSSGTAASILNNSEGSGASLLQAVFYPKKDFDGNTSVTWTGELHNMWYYLDPYLQNTSIREDSTQDFKLNLQQDKIAQFYFDSAQNKTQVRLFNDLNGDGIADSSTPSETIDPDYVKSLWKAGRKLWARTLSSSPRLIYTHTDITPAIAAGFDDATTKLTPFGYTSAGVSNSSTLTANSTFLSLINTTDTTKAGKLISYVHGTDQSADSDGTKYRSRKVTIDACSVSGSGCETSNSIYNREWKLGDIVSSTPKLVSNVPLNSYYKPIPLGYADSSYKAFTLSDTYAHRGMVFVGSNDGLLHAFKLGVLKENTGIYEKAQFNNSSGTLASSSDDLGREEWAYIPKQALPYLKYIKDYDYCHVYTVDKTSAITEVSIGRPASCSNGTDYWDCSKSSDGSTWRTVLIGGMGIGGAAKWNGNSTYTAPGDCVKTPVKGTSATSGAVGYSSYFALDVTDPASPSYMWEFPGTTAAAGDMGFSTTGPAVVRIAAKTSTVTDNSKNGRWFAVFASGPTGYIDTTTRQFKGQSDQNLKIYVVDMSDGTLVRTITQYKDSSGTLVNLPSYAFAGSLATAVVDTDRATSSSSGFYSDDAVYIGFVKKDSTTWTKGGIIRLLTNNSTDPADWVASMLIDDIGPVTSSVTKLQDRANYTLWIYAGTGRFFYKGDDNTSQQVLYGIKDPCYSTLNRGTRFPSPISSVTGGTNNAMDHTCYTPAPKDSFINQSGSTTTSPTLTLAATDPGWYINLDTSAGSFFAERMITDPVASASGAVFFTTFKPSNDVCKFGGDSLIWAVNYKSGAAPYSQSMQGKALMQVSTGAFAEISLSSAFSNSGNLRLDGRRLSTAISGVPPTAQGLSLLTNPKPIKKLLHIQEK